MSSLMSLFVPLVQEDGGQHGHSQYKEKGENSVIHLVNSHLLVPSYSFRDNHSNKSENYQQTNTSSHNMYFLPSSQERVYHQHRQDHMEAPYQNTDTSSLHLTIKHVLALSPTLDAIFMPCI